MKQAEWLAKLNSMPRSIEWCKNISRNKRRGKFKPCAECGLDFWVRPHNEENARFCSRSCKGRWWFNHKNPNSDPASVRKSVIKRRFQPRPNMTGNKNPAWRGGITPVNKIVRKSIDYRIWRESVFERDNWTCVTCKKRGVELNADHIKPFSLFINLRFSLENGRTLCVSCHKKTETFAGKIQNYVY